MFYSHQILARKAPLGQVWMAATMHAKMNRKKLHRINIINICEEILNPSVPMALRLSSILMGGVVIVYERKVKLLYDDVNRLLVEINEAWKVKPTVDPTMLPRGKTQAKYEAVTMPENQYTELGDIEQSMDFSNQYTMGLQQTAYFAMRLDNIEDLNKNLMEEDFNQNHHQAEAANITIETYGSYQADTGPCNRFERFDIEGDEETLFNFPSHEHAQVPTTPIRPSTPQEEHQRADDILDQHPEHQVNQHSDGINEAKEAKIHLQMQEPKRRKTRRAPPFIMDNEQTIIPGNLYQSWLQNTSDILSRRRKNRKLATSRSAMKITQLMDLPPVAIGCGLIENGNKVHYPEPLMELWTRSIQPPFDSPSRRTSLPRPPEPSSSSPPANGHLDLELPEFPMGDLNSGVRMQPLSPRETLMRETRIKPRLHIPGIPIPEGMDETHANLKATTPNGSGTVGSVSLPSGGSGSDGTSGRSSKKRPFSGSIQSGGGLETVIEENHWGINPEPDFAMAEDPPPPEPLSKKTRHSQVHPTPDYELMVETGPTQTQRPRVINQDLEIMTNTIRTHLKTYFEAPGAPQRESLDQLALGMTRKQAAQLFYQTCVLAARDVLKVEQRSAYGDILIARGVKM